MSPYEILSSDVTNDENQQLNSSSNPNQQPPQRNYLKIAIILLHITLILGCLFLIYVIFVTPFLFEDNNNFKLTGEISNFSTVLNQTITINVGEYELELESGTKLNGENEEFIFTNFSGNLELINQSFVLSGKSPNLKTKTSEIKANNQHIILTFKQGGVEVELDMLQMNISSNLDISYQPDLVYSTQEESVITISNFTGILSHDSLIGLYGSVGKFEVINSNSQIKFE